MRKHSMSSCNLLANVCIAKSRLRETADVLAAFGCNHPARRPALAGGQVQRAAFGAMCACMVAVAYLIREKEKKELPAAGAPAQKPREGF